MSSRLVLKSLLFATTALAAIAPVRAQTAPNAADSGDIETVIVTSERTVQSSVAIGVVQAQKLLPGINPLKAIETLPGVVYETADPWGNNEQNESLVVHGFTTQQLGYTMDGVPLGDQQYGNYNGLSPSRALTSENTARTTLSSGAGSLGVASTSNLGGAIESYSSDPLQVQQFDARETYGSYYTTRTFLRFDTGDMGDGNTAFVSYLHQDARAWDFDGHQRGDQFNVKFIHDDNRGKLTLYADYDNKVEPNEDATSFGNQQSATSTYIPYTRPFLFPNLAAGLGYLNSAGAPPAVYGNNFSNYFSAAQREDALTYAKYDWTVNDAITWSNQLYYHHDTARGIVAGPVNQAGLPGLFAIYFPGQNLVQVFGGTGYEVRTTEYRINRGGERSTLNWTLGDHQIEAGLWYEYNAESQHRVWYPFSAANTDLTPYQIPTNRAFTQYAFTFNTDDLQLHLQDQWRILPDVLLQAGIKASLQHTGDQVPVQQKNLPTTNPPVQYPVGVLDSNNWFLPQVGAVWDATDAIQLFFNIQKNMRQYIPYGAGGNFYGASPYSLGSQAAFETFKQTAHPETSWTYEVGARSHADVGTGLLSSIDGQINYYHVDFSNRLFNVSAYNFINPNPSVLVNVGGVTTDGADLAITLNFGEHFHLYDAVSYNKSTYNSNYTTANSAGTGLTTVAIAGMQVPLTPDWLEKFVASTDFGPFEAQVNGDYIGRRFVTYLNDLAVSPTFQLGLEASYTLPVADMGMDDLVKKLKFSLNLTNVTDTTGVSTAVVTGASGGYQAYPLSPRMAFVTVGAAL